MKTSIALFHFDGKLKLNFVTFQIKSISNQADQSNGNLLYHSRNNIKGNYKLTFSFVYYLANQFSNLTFMET